MNGGERPRPGNGRLPGPAGDGPAARPAGAEERRRAVLAAARREGLVRVDVLAGRFGVSRETVRRDLKALEDDGLVRRTHGGAVARAGPATGPPPWQGPPAPPQAPRIALAAARLLGVSETVFVDEGPVARLVAEALPQDRALTVVTASPAVAALLAGAAHTTVLLLGGRVGALGTAAADAWTVRMLAGVAVDLAYVGADGVSLDFGLTAADPAVGEVRAQALRSAGRRILVGAHAVFGVVRLCRFGEVADLEAVVTDTGLPVSEARRYAALGPRVVRA
ncbi:DeoR/GlpR family DNA-binding transcription regulator [Streptomyces sanyensis]|uniref:DeoR/GlpR family DNA-binding transcription regulator n=1 Tax=Streptomyces sanyensis TaxID=568869 RepID=UPI003D77C5EE